MKLGDFLNSQAIKLGLQSDPALIAILSNSEIANRDLADSFANALDGGLMSLDSAKNNVGLKNHFFSQALNGVDTKLVDGLELDEEALNALKGEKNTYAKLDILKTQIKALKEKKVDTDDKTKKAEYERQIQELNAQVLKAKEGITKAVKDTETKYESELNDILFSSALMSKQFANKDLKPEENAVIARTIIESALKENGAIVVRDGRTFKLKQSAAPELDFFKDNKAVSFDEFSNKVLADRKLLAVSGGIPPITPAAPTIIPGQQIQNTSAFAAALAAAQGDIKTE